MAVYRETPRSRLPLLIGIGVAALVVIIVAVLALRPNTPPAPPNSMQVNMLGTLNTISANLDVFSIEYAKIKQGSAPNQTGAPDAIQRALKALVEQRAALSTLDDEALATLERDLNTIFTALAKSPVPDQADTFKDAQNQLAKLNQVLSQRK
jgi:hypothetical protein